MLVGPNLAVRFLLEIAALVALAYAGWQADGALGWVLAIALPVAAAALWGIFVAPKRAVDAPPSVRLLVETIVLGGAAVALVVTGHWVLGLAFAAVAVLNRLAVRSALK